MKKFVAAVICFAMVCLELSAQDTLTIREAENMKIRAVNLVQTDLRDLLNNIANSENDDIDVQNMIHNSFSGEKNRIFLDPTINIEDDLDPTLKNSGTIRDSKPEKYLRDFDLNYTKSSSPSIIIQTIKSSNPKKGTDHIFVKVYFTSYFQNPNKTIQEKYTINNRVADVRFEKKENKWKPLIQRISFFDPEDTLNDNLNDILITNPDGFQGNDSTFISSKNKEMEEERQKIIDEERASQKRFNDLIDKAEKATNNKEYIAAQQYYKDAKAERPYDPLPGIRMRKVQSLQDEAMASKEKIADGYIKQAENEALQRNFQKASALYKKAIKENPDYQTKYQTKINELDDKWAIVSQLQEKFDNGGNYKDMVEDYDKAIKKNKENSDLYLGQAQCYYKLNNLQKALKDCDLAIEKDRTNLPAYKLRAELKKKQNELKNDQNILFEALSDYNIYLNYYPEDSSVYELKSDLLMMIKTDNYDKAIKALQDGIDINPKWANLHYKKGLLHYQKNDLGNAKKSFTTAISNDTLYPLSYYQRGRVELALNDIENAASDFEKSRKKGLDSEYIRIIYDNAQDFNMQSVKKFADSKVDSAIKLIDNAIAINPLKSEYHFKKGEYFIALSKNNEAVTSLTTAVKLDPQLIEAWFKLGLAYFNLGNYTTAGTNFKQAIDFNTNHFMARKGLGDAFYALKDYKNAAQSYEGFLGIINTAKTTADPLTIAQVYNSLGNSYFKINQADGLALEAFKNAIKKNQNYAEAYFNRGLFYHKNNELTSAIKDLEQAVSLDGKNTSWNYELGQAYQDKRDFPNAINFYNNTIKADSLKKYPEVLYKLANCYFESQDYTNALTYYQQVQSRGLDSGINKFNYILGNTYLNLAKTDSAFQYLHKAFQKDSTDENILYAYAIAQLQKGNQDEALRLFEKAFQSGKLNKKQIKNDKLVADFKEDKRFKALMNKYF